MWSEAPQFIIQIREVDKVINAVGLPVLAKVTVEEGGVDDVWHCWNIWYNCSFISSYWRNSYYQIAPSKLWLYEQIKAAAAFLAVVGSFSWCGLIPYNKSITINYLSYSSWTTTTTTSLTASSSKVTLMASTHAVLPWTAREERLWVSLMAEFYYSEGTTSYKKC